MVLLDAKFDAFLLLIDEDLAAKTRAVMITRVALPLGRGSALSGYDRSPALRLMVLLNLPSATSAGRGAPMARHEH
jgi:hypothetical protein